jgi:hypothetical protein
MVLYAYVCAFTFSLHQESPDRILGDKLLLVQGGSITSTREEEGQGGGSYSTRPAGHVARLTGCHMVSYHLSQVNGAPPQPYKYPLR